MACNGNHVHLRTEAMIAFSHDAGNCWVNACQSVIGANQSRLKEKIGVVQCTWYLEEIGSFLMIIALYICLVVHTGSRIAVV